MLSEESTVTAKPSSFEEDPSCLVQFFVVKPFSVKLSLVILFPSVSSTPVVTLILYVVEKNKLEDGLIENVLSEFEDDGEDDIWTQVLKLSEETWKVPVQPVPDEFVVTVSLFTASEKVIEMLSFSETELSSSLGDVDKTNGSWFQGDSFVRRSTPYWKTWFILVSNPTTGNVRSRNSR